MWRSNDPFKTSSTEYSTTLLKLETSGATSQHMNTVQDAPSAKMKQRPWNTFYSNAEAPNDQLSGI